MQKDEQALKLKLHEAYKEFIATSETMTKLKKEAIKGTEAAESRNDMLQRNLDKLAVDFENTTRELSSANLKIKELQFEMEELVQQFNMTGEAKKKTEELNLKITNDLTATSKALNDTKEDLEQVILQRSKLEADIGLLDMESTQTKTNLEIRIQGLTSDLQTTLSIKSDLEYQIRQLKAEIEKLNSSLKTMTKGKELADSNLKASQLRLEKEVTTRDKRIVELENARGEDAKTIKKLQESREQLRAQVTDLQNNLDREASALNQLNFETSQYKRAAEEKIAGLEDQLSKLTGSKNTLSSEKKQLSDKLKAVRQELKEREEELELTKLAYKRQCDESHANDISLRDQIATLEASLSNLTKDHSTLLNEHGNLNEEKAYLENLLKVANQKIEQFEARDKEQLQRISQLESKNEFLIKEHSQAVQERVAAKIHLDAVLNKVEELTRTVKYMEEEYTAKMKEADTQITRLSNDLDFVREERLRLQELSTNLKDIVSELDTELVKTRNNLSAETMRREALESQLFESTLQFNNERKLRSDFEKMNSRLQRSDEVRTLERLSALRMRDHKLSELDKELNSQLKHLSSIVTLLPRGFNFGETDAKPIPLFNPPQSLEPPLSHQKAPFIRRQTKGVMNIKEERRKSMIHGKIGPTIAE